MRNKKRKKNKKEVEEEGEEEQKRSVLELLLVTELASIDHFIKGHCKLFESNLGLTESGKTLSRADLTLCSLMTGPWLLLC